MAKQWSEDEDEILLDNSLNNVTYDDLKLLLPNRSRDAIMVRCSKLNINNLIINPSNTWTNNEIEIIKLHYSITTDEEICLLIPNKTKRAIGTCATRLGLHKDEEVLKKIKTKNSHKSHLYWNVEKQTKLKELISISGYNKSIYDVFPEYTHNFINSKIKELNITLSNGDKILAIIKKDNFNNLNLSDIFKLYKNILNKELKDWHPISLTREQIILCFKYYLKINNINFQKGNWLNICFGKWLENTKLKTFIKKKFNGYYDFITSCFPKYNFKQWSFSFLDVPNQFWEYKYNRYACYEYGIGNMIKDNYINDISEILSVNHSVLKSYLNPTLLSKYKLDGLLEYLKSQKIEYKEYSQKFIYNNILFDSKEEKDLFMYLDSLKLNVCKATKKDVFRNKLYNESYYPDYQINTSNFNKRIIIEYYGLFRENYNNSTILYNYYHKTLRKNEYYKSRDDIYFIDLYPKDLKNNFQGVREKLTSFFMQKFNILINVV